LIMATSDTNKRSIIIRNIETLAEMRGVEDLQREVWGATDVVPLTQLIATREVGGILAGAFDADELVGFVYGFIGREGTHLVIHSHMLAVRPAYRNHDLGYKLKLAQRAQALTEGFDRITWTFDPLQSRNAHLNFMKLGVIADRYKPDFYGAESESALHRHIGTDRLWVTWLLKSERVNLRLKDKPPEEHLPPEMLKAVTLIEANESGVPVLKEKIERLKGEPASIEIPGDIGVLQEHEPELAARWREATRRAFTEALAAGYLVEEFYRRSRNGQRLGVYLLTRKKEGEDFI
jgi:predicted GNAT superfamily acetyltransferase